MNGLSFRPTMPTAVPRTAPVARPLAAPAAALSSAEEAQIADAFPARPSVAQKLYGPSRQVHQPAVLGTRLDLSA